MLISHRDIPVCSLGSVPKRMRACRPGKADIVSPTALRHHKNLYGFCININITIAFGLALAA